MNATREQLLAMSSDRHCIVSASAGSGKTSVLVQRYVRLLLKGVDARHIVAITFTRKAAAEMLARAAEAVESRLNIEGTPAEMRKLKEIRERLTSARISTIHSFCGRLLREFPVEADVHPNFVEQSENDAIQMRRDTVEETLIEFLSNDESKAGTEQLILGLGRQTLQAYLEFILVNREKLEILRRFYSRSDEQCLQNAEAVAIEIIKPMLRRFADAASAILEGIYSEIYTKKQSADLSEARTNFNRIKDLLRGETAREELGEILQLISATTLPIFTKKGELQKYWAGVCDTSALQFAPLVTEGFAFADSISKAASRRDRDAEMIRLGRLIFTISAAAAADIEEKKRKSGELDFDDLQIKCLALLENKTVCKKIRRKLKYLMLDEFQDTNELQYRLAKRIVSALGTSDNADDSPNIYVVGDAKQSIYGFRGADARIFDEAKRDIISANIYAERNGRLLPFSADSDSASIEMSERERYGDVRITASFRLSPAIAAFVNKVCGKIMPPESQGYEVGYDSMVCARKTDRIENDVSSVIFLVAHRNSASNSENTSDDLNETYDSDNEAQSNESPSEAAMLARYIRNAAGGKNPLMITAGRDEQPRQASFGDIAVLLRSRSTIDKLANALRRENVPFIIHAGTGFYSTQEIMDIRSYLSFLHNPNNDLALAAVLRSPYFGVSDAGLYVIAGNDESRSLWEKLLCYESHSEWAFDYAVIRARSILTELLPLAPRLTIPILIRLLVERSGWRRIIRDSERAEQMEANIEKIIGIARDFEHKGFRNLYDFTEELAVLATGETNESEATVSATADVVNIMTIHAAKGLEFPIVALYNANSGSGKSERNIEIFEDFGICFATPDKIDDYNVVQPTFIGAAAADIRKKAEQAEEKRLLYVALTRAKDHLIISSTVIHKKNGGLKALQGFFKLIMEGAEIDDYELYSTHSNKNFTLDNMQFLMPDGTIKTAVCPIPLFIEIESAEATEILIATAIESSPVKILVQDIPAVERDTIFSASQIMLFENDINEYILRYRLGMPDDNEIELSAGHIDADEEKDLIIGSFAGTIIHETLAEMNKWSDNEQALERIVNSVTARSERAVPDALSRRVTNECRNVASTSLITSYKEQSAAAKIEYTLQMPLGDDFLLGVIDVLLQNRSGEWEIWDWKTNRVENQNEVDELSKKYCRQLQIYSVLCAALFPEQEYFTARLLFTRLAYKDAQNDAWTREFRWSRAEIRGFAEEIGNIVAHIKELA